MNFNALEAQTKTCTQCFKHTENEAGTDVGEGFYCDSCYEKLDGVCFECGEYLEAIYDKKDKFNLKFSHYKECPCGEESNHEL